MRIGFAAPRKPTLEVLRSIHRAHLLSIPYENLDIHLGRPLTLDPDDAFRRLVTERRGGWCYEMNGLLGRVLTTLGFNVSLVCGAVQREARGDSTIGNHAVLLVRIGEHTFIADAGLGDGFLEPLTLRSGHFGDAPWTTRIEPLHELHSGAGMSWRVRPHARSSVVSFDLGTIPVGLDRFSAKCQELQTSPASPFVQTIVVQRFVPGGIVTLRGAVLSRVPSTDQSRHVVRSADAYVNVLRDTFGLAHPDFAGLWPSVSLRHAEWEAEQSSRATSTA